MTSYLTSYLIDPVARQVRRLSESGYAAADDPRPHGPDSGQDGAHDFMTGQDAHSAVMEDPQRGSVLAGPLMASPSSSPVPSPPLASVERGGRPRNSASLPLRGPRSHHSTRLLDSATRSNTAPVNEETTQNPSRAVPARLLSSSANAISMHRSHAAESDLVMTTSEHDALSIEDSRSLQFPARRSRNGSLPADDGQSVLRKRIVEIQETDAPAGEKARLMHLVMTEPYTLLHPNLPLSHLARPQSPASLLSHDRPYTPSSLNSGSGFGPRPSTPTSMSSVQADMAYSLRPEDLEPTYVPNASSAANTRPASSNEINGARDVEAAEPTSPVFGCQHYKRNVKLQCSACQRWYTCRFCHDDVEDHSLNRRETRNMLCMLCGCAQPAAERCVDCDQRAAWYYCSICKLWDDETEKSIYHCTDCGICRVGRGLGKDYFHCSTCCVCMSISIAQSHKCIERSTDCDCPICGEYMFTSPLTVVFMQCGHSIHHKCYYEHMKTSYRCPICSRSIVNMETQFRNLDRSIASQPMPSQFQDTKALVSCNDCSAKSSVKYHWLGSKCGVCDSYNTAQLQILTARHPASRMPAVADEAPGPSTAETRPSPLLSAEATRLSEPPARVPAGPQRRPTSSGHSAARARFSPYIVPQRTGRSISPIPMSNGFLAVPLPQAESIETDTVSMDDEDEEVDFWGRDGRVEDDSEMDDVEDEEDAEEDEEDDDDDDEMELFGHR